MKSDARLVARMVGLDLPVPAMEHRYLLSGDIAEVVEVVEVAEHNLRHVERMRS